jgi:hypothetical protein
MKASRKPIPASSVQRDRQWYDSPQGAYRLRTEMDAIELFNEHREPDLRLRGKKHADGHLVFLVAFRPVAGRPDKVRGELILPSEYPSVEPFARIDEPAISGRHVLPASLAGALSHGTLPPSWLEESSGRILCMYAHGGSPDSWQPRFSVIQAVLNVQMWTLCFLVHRQTGRWPLDE